jgi:hypothetical protein
MLVEINELISVAFVAQDPNPGDTVEIMILDDPGLPAGMTTSGTVCIPRAGSSPPVPPPAAGMCSGLLPGSSFVVGPLR